MKNLFICTAVILTAAIALLYVIGCGDGSNRDITGGGNVDSLIHSTRGTNEPKEVETYTLKVTAAPAAGGTFSKSPDKSQYAKGESVLLTATPKAGYRFTGWSGSQSSTDAAITVKMDGKKELVANFLPENTVSYTLTVSSNPTAGGTFSKSPDKLEYASGDAVRVTAKPNDGYKFIGWSGSSASNDSVLTITMNEKKELTANFAPRTYTLTINAETGGTVSSNPGKSAYEYGEKVTVTAYPVDGYKFTGWSGASAETKNPITVTVDGDKTLSANFEWNGTTPPPNVPDPTYTLNVSANPSDGGSVSLSPNKTSYTSGERVTATASAYSGYTFKNWSGASSSTSSSITVTMDGDKTLTAVFELVIVTYTVTFSANGGNGSVSNQSAQANSSITLRSGNNLSKSGYTFGGWNTNSSGTGTNYSAGSYYLLTGNVTLYAKWETIPTYRVTFNANGGSGTVAALSSQSGGSVTLPSGSSLSRSGYIFDCWNTNSYGTGINYYAGSPYTLSDDVTLYAKWIDEPTTQIIAYTITLDANGGTVSPTFRTTGEGGRLTSLPTPTRDGYTFNGWYTSTTGGTPVSESRSYTANTTIYAQWTLITYTITFDASGGTVSPTSGTTGEGWRLASLPTPTRTGGYTFNGWYTSTTGGTQVTESRAYTANTTIYAQWTVIPYTITFDANGGTVSQTSSTTGDGGRLASLPTPTRTGGYTFNGWYTAATGGSQVTTGTAFSANATVYARWTLVTYTITFNANQGTVSPTSATTGEGGTLASLPIPTRSGYAFNGWYTAATGGTAVTESRTYSANTTIYAQWTLGTYTITFNAGGGSVTPTSGTTGSSGRLASLPTPTRSGYTFKGWYTTETGNSQVTTSTTFSADATVYAQWTLIQYTITFNANSGSVSPTSDKTGEGGKLASLPTPTRSGYTFDGWYTATTGETAVTISTTFSANTTIYARWTLITYTITFDANWGTVSSASGTTGAGGTLSSLPTPTRNGYTFSGWFTNTTGGTAVTTSTTFSANTTIYARWTLITYTITFDANWGTVSSASGTTGAGGTLSSLPTPTRSGHTFDGWFTASTGGASVTASTVFSANTTIYARWSIPTPTITTFPDSRDGTTYKKVTIGTQTWMAENLNYDVPNNTSDVCYDNNPSNCGTYGRLYDWSAAMNGSSSSSSNPSGVQGVCPVNWHLPSDAEWTTLTNYVGGTTNAGTKLKSSTGWNTYSGVPKGTNDYGFSALPGGNGNSVGDFRDAGDVGYWWSATEDNASSAWLRYMYHNNEFVGRNLNNKTSLSSVRCVQD